MSGHRRPNPRHNRGARGRASDRWYVEPDTEEIPVDVGLGILDTSYAPDTPDRPPRRRWPVLIGCLLLVVGVVALGWYAVTSGVFAITPLPAAAPAATAAQDPTQDPAAAPSTVAVESAPDGQLGPGRWQVGTGDGQAAPGVYLSGGPSVGGIPCYAEVFRRGPSDTAVGASVTRVSVDAGSARLRVPAVAGVVITTGCQPWRPQ